MSFFIGLALALVAGVFGTIFHQSQSAQLPLGLILSLSGVALLAIGSVGIAILILMWPRIKS